MARPLRLEFPGAVYHITARGNAKGAIYLGRQDRLKFLTVLGEVCERYRWNCYAYVLMTNHYHLVVETTEPTLCRGMRQLNGVYSQSFNHRYQRVGHLLQGRFKAILVDRQSYLAEVIRYVILNPVRAGMLKSAGQYHWSSYHLMAGKTPAPAWFPREWLLSQFGNVPDTAFQRFADFVSDGAGRHSIMDNVRQQIYLGDQDFVSLAQDRLDESADLDEIPGQQRKTAPRPLAVFESLYERKEAMKMAYESGDYTLKKIAAHFGVHYSTVSRIVKGDK